VFAGRERVTRSRTAAAGGVGVEIDRDGRVGQAIVAVGAPSETAIGRRQDRELCRVAAEQYRLRHQAVAIGEHQATLPTDCHQRAQVLRGAEASRRAVNDNTDVARGHAGCFLKERTDLARS
jgi:hypothetical protein